MDRRRADRLAAGRSQPDGRQAPPSLAARFEPGGARRLRWLVPLGATLLACSSARPAPSTHAPRPAPEPPSEATSTAPPARDPTFEQGGGAPLVRDLVRGVFELRVRTDTDAEGERSTARRPKRRSTCVLVSTDGLAVTNAHVLTGARRLEAISHDGRRFPATIVGVDADSDIALIRLTGELGSLRPLTWADALPPRGATVYTIGNALGSGLAVTRGIVADTGRTSLGHATYEDYVMTDARVARGVSGGAVCDADGALVGIAVGALDDGETGAAFGLAISSRLARSVVDVLLARGEAGRLDVGMTLDELDTEASERLGLAQARGARVAELAPGGAADRAGLTVDDVVTRAGGWDIQRPGNLKAALATLGPGAEVPLTVVRRGETLTLTFSLAARSAPTPP